jgi:hypothetical protein
MSSQIPFVSNQNITQSEIVTSVTGLPDSLHYNSTCTVGVEVDIQKSCHTLPPPPANAWNREYQFAVRFSNNPAGKFMILLTEVPRSEIARIGTHIRRILLDSGLSDVKYRFTVRIVYIYQHKLAPDAISAFVEKLKENPTLATCIQKPEQSSFLFECTTLFKLWMNRTLISKCLILDHLFPLKVIQMQLRMASLNFYNQRRKEITG